MTNKIKLPACGYYVDGGHYECKIASCSDAGSKCKFRDMDQSICPSYAPEGGFDAVAAAVGEAGLWYEVNSFSSQKHFAVVGEKVHQKGETYWISSEYAWDDDTPTAALVAACLAFNSEENNAKSD